MPIMDGFKSSKKIKKLIAQNNLNNILIIGFTSLLTEKEKNKSLKNKMDYILQKPLTYQQLKTFIVPLLNFN